jgi:PIN domain nuclease of toxin-antitoxin system
VEAEVILLDTHALLWMADDDPRLSRRAREAILQAKRKTGVAVAAITLREVAWLAQNGRIFVTGSVESFVTELVSPVIIRPITPQIAALSVGLPEEFSKDPADCLIAATAMVEGMTLVTADADIRKSKIVDTVW